MTTLDITVPDIGDVENVEVIEILVSIGDTVGLDDSLITLESDKASMEVPAMASGVIQTLTVEVGSTVNSGDVIGTLETLETTDNNSPNINPASEKNGSDKDSAETTVEPPAPEASVISSTPKDSSKDSRASTEKSPNNELRTGQSPTAHLTSNNQVKSHASPGVRRYARELGADLNLIQGSGNKNRIVKDDVTQFIKHSMESLGSNYGTQTGAQGVGIPAIPEVDFSRFGDIERVELGRINKLSASNLHRAWLNVPMVTHHDEADITELESFRKTLKAQAKEGDAKVTGLAFHMKALVQTLKTFPKLNSSMAPDGQSLIFKSYFHIGIAVDTPNGLVVPVFRDVDKKSINELAIEMADISARARAKKLKPDELQGASMTISSLGGIGGTAFTPIVNPPEVAILGITRAKMKPVWNGTEFIPRLICPLDLSYDHRVVDGADAARFMAAYCDTIGDIRRLLL